MLSAISFKRNCCLWGKGVAANKYSNDSYTFINIHANKCQWNLFQADNGVTQHGSFSLTGVFSLGFTDIPYCDCVGGKCV